MKPFVELKCRAVKGGKIHRKREHIDGMGGIVPMVNKLVKELLTILNQHGKRD